MQKEEDLGIVIGTILSIEKVENSDKLYIVNVDTGIKRYQIATSLVSFYDNKNLIGKQIPIKIDVKTVKIRGVKSNARMIAIMNEDKTPTLLIPEERVSDGVVVM